MKIRNLFALSVLFIICSCKSSKVKTNEVSTSPYTFDFQEFDILSELVDKAREENKLVFLDIYTTWCLPCKIMDKDVFTDKRLGEFMNENFVSGKVNAEVGSGPIIAELYKVPGFPTLLFLDQNGRVIVETTGVAYQREMYELAEEALARNKNDLE